MMNESNIADKYDLMWFLVSLFNWEYSSLCQSLLCSSVGCTSNRSRWFFVKLDGMVLWAAICRSLHRCSVGFRSLWSGFFPRTSSASLSLPLSTHSMMVPPLCFTVRIVLVGHEQCPVFSRHGAWTSGREIKFSVIQESFSSQIPQIPLNAV